MLAVSLDLVAGMTGLYSLGHAGLFALGAYATTILYNDHHWNLFLILPACLLGVGAVGLVLGAISLRVSGLYFAITTFVFTLVVTVFASDSTFTGGYGGLIGPIFPEFPPGSRGLGSRSSGRASSRCSSRHSSCSRSAALPSTRSCSRSATPSRSRPSAGASTAAVRIGLFGLSAAIAGGAGWMFAFQGIVSPSQFSWQVSVNILVMVILGGINTTIGPILGAVFITVFPAQVNINPFWQEILFGALFVGVIVVFPSGFVGLIRLIGRQIGRRLGLAGPAAPRVEEEQPGIVDAAAVSAVARAEESAAAASANGSVAEAPAIDCRDISFRYGSGPLVLNGVDFTVRAGDDPRAHRTERLREEHARRPDQWATPTGGRVDRDRRGSGRPRRRHETRRPRCRADLPVRGARQRTVGATERPGGAVFAGAAPRRTVSRVARAAVGPARRPAAARRRSTIRSRSSARANGGGCGSPTRPTASRS